MKKQYIKAIDVVAEALRKWYIILICIVLMAVAVPNFKYNNDKRLAESNKLLIEQMQAKADGAAASDANVKYPDAYYEVQNQIDEWKAYLDRSAFMKLDPYNMSNVKLTYAVDDYNVALPAYMAYINKRTMADEIGAKLDNYSAEDIQDLVTSELIGFTENSKVLSVNIYASNKEESDVLASAVKEAIETYATTKGLAQAQLMDETYFEGTFTAVYDTQASYESRTSTLVTKRDSYIPNKTDTTSTTTTTATTEMITEAHFNKTYVIIGAVLGAVLGVLVIIIMLCVSDKIRTDYAINESFGLDYIGRINKAKASKWHSFVDRLCYKRYSASNILLSALRIAKMCQGADVEKLYLTGHITDCLADIEPLIKELKNQGIEAVWIDSFSNDAQVLAKVIENGNVLFIDELGRAHFGDVAQDVTVAGEQNVNVLGYMTIAA